MLIRLLIIFLSLAPSSEQSSYCSKIVDGMCETKNKILDCKYCQKQETEKSVRMDVYSELSFCKKKGVDEL